MVAIILRVRLYYSMGLDLGMIHDSLVDGEGISEENFYLAYNAAMVK